MSEETARADQLALTNEQLTRAINGLEAEAEELNEENESLAVTIEEMGKSIAALEHELKMTRDANAELRRLVVRQFEMHGATIEQLGECLGQPDLAAAGRGQASAALMAASLGCTVEWLPE